MTKRYSCVCCGRETSNAEFCRDCNKTTRRYHDGPPENCAVGDNEDARWAFGIDECNRDTIIDHEVRIAIREMTET